MFNEIALINLTASNHSATGNTSISKAHAISVDVTLILLQTVDNQKQILANFNS